MQITPLSERVALMALLAVLSAGGGYLIFTGHEVPDWYAGLIGLLASWLLGVKTSVVASPGSGLGGADQPPPADWPPPPPATGTRNEAQSVAAPSITGQDAQHRQRARNEPRASNKSGRLVDPSMNSLIKPKPSSSAGTQDGRGVYFPGDPRQN